MGYIKNTEKYTLQFPISFGDYVIGSDGTTGATKNFTIASLAQLIIDNIDTPITALISVESITLDGNEITVINAVYAINGFVYTVEEQVLAISYAQEGYYRSDLLIGNTDGVLVLLPGEESTIVSLPPSLPIDTVGIATINVFGNTIEIVPSSEAPTLQEVLESGSIGVVDKNISIVSADFDNNEVLGIEAIYSAGLNIYKQTEDGSAGLELRFDEQGVKVIDSIDNVGLVGAEDFSSNATSLSYIQKGYVDAQIADVETKIGNARILKIQAVGGSLQSDELIGATILSFDADGISNVNWENDYPDIVFDNVTGEVSGIDTFPDSWILFHFTKPS